MAKAKTLAALAGLAGLAYAMNKKGESKTDTGDETDRLKGRGTPEEPRTDARSSGDEMSDIRRDVSSGDEMSKYASNYKPPKSVTPKAPPKSADAKQAPSGRREDEAGTSRGQRSFTSRSSGDEMSSAAKSYKAPAPTTSSKVGDAATDAVKTVAKAAVQGPAASIATAAKPLADKATNAMRETYRDLSGKVQYKTPDIPSAAKTVGDAVASGAKKVGSGIADYANRTFTLEGRERAKKEADDARAKAASSREYDEDVLSKGSAMRRGGMTKMASGGMTASSRADGIASRGKTRGKIC
jgi:hypothetical protein